MYCPYCRRKGVDALSVCPKCGKSLMNVKQESDIECSACKRDNPTDALYCWFCGEKFEEDSTEATVDQQESDTRSAVSNWNHDTEQDISEVDTPVLSIIFYILGGLEILGGVVLFGILWPDSSNLEYGYTYKTSAYLDAWAWLFAGLISGFLFIALGEILRYLKMTSSTIQYLVERR